MKKPLHQLIAESSTQIIETFITQVREHVLPERTLTREEAADHLHRYLVEMVAVLSAGMAEQVKSSAAAKEHGEQRWYVGYDLKSVVLEYALFRKAILFHIEQAGEAPTLAECEPLDRFINVAIADAAVEFMASSMAQVNDALRLSQQAQDAREEVLAVVSHDLKNPLAVIHGGAAQLARALDGPELDSKRAQLSKNVARIQRATANMNRLITDLSDVGQLRGGGFQLDLRECEVAGLVREAIARAMPLAEEQHVRLHEAAIAPGLLLCDGARVLQVLDNLLGNAIKFCVEGGLVTVRVTAAPHLYTFDVADTGPGIPPERLPFVFDRYWRAPDTQTPGSGVGLAIAKGFVELHGGRIWCESTVGEGSHFAFTLPKKQTVLPGGA